MSRHAVLVRRPCFEARCQTGAETVNSQLIYLQLFIAVNRAQLVISAAWLSPKSHDPGGPVLEHEVFKGSAEVLDAFCERPAVYCALSAFLTAQDRIV